MYTRAFEFPFELRIHPNVKRQLSGKGIHLYIHVTYLYTASLLIQFSIATPTYICTPWAQKPGQKAKPKPMRYIILTVGYFFPLI